jgi:hypothetical protein
VLVVPVLQLGRPAGEQQRGQRLYLA